MNIDLIVVGKTDEQAVRSLIEKYMKRINRYVKFSVVVVPEAKASKNTTADAIKKQEAELLLRQINQADYVVLLDERGTECSSREFSVWLQKIMNSGVKRLVFLIGGAYGFDETVRKRATQSLSLSRMTFSHQIIRAIFAEQLYRAFSILNNEPYHND